MRRGKTVTFAFFLTVAFCGMEFAQNGLYQAWVRHYAGPFSVESAKDIAVDQHGNVYVASASFDTTSSTDYSIIKYNSAGDEQWTARYTTPGKFPDRPRAIAVDALGNVYVTGRSNSDYLTIKYNSEGIQQWSMFYNGPGNRGDIANDIAVDDSGNVYVTGTVVVANQPYSNRFTTIKYNSEGIEKWVSLQSIDAPGSAQAIALDSQRNVFVTGKVSLDTLDEDYLIIKYNSNGIEQWTARYNGTGNSYDTARDIIIDDSGNVYVTGYSVGAGTEEDYATVKYNSNGVEQWVARFNGPANYHDNAWGIALDNSGNIYVTGTSSVVLPDDNYATIKYNPEGIEQWVSYYDGPPDSYGWAVDISLDALANVFVFGWTNDYWGTNKDYALVKYDSSGQQLSDISYDSGADDYAVAMAIDTEGNIYVTGYSESSVSLLTTIKYTREPTSIYNEKQLYQVTPLLHQNYPNPFNSTTQISYYLPISGYVSLRVYNLLGQEIATLVQSKQISGEHEIVFNGTELPSGVYVLRLVVNSFGESGSFITARKLLLLK